MCHVCTRTYPAPAKTSQNVPSDLKGSSPHLLKYPILFIFQQFAPLRLLRSLWSCDKHNLPARVAAQAADSDHPAELLSSSLQQLNRHPKCTPGQLAAHELWHAHTRVERACFANGPTSMLAASPNDTCWPQTHAPLITSADASGTP